MDEFGETPAFYVWPEGHEEGDPMPAGFYQRVQEVLRKAGYDCETL